MPEASTRPTHPALTWRRDALELWGERGIDSRGLFYEQLDFDGRGDADSRRRMRVQARQLYVFARAEARGEAGAAAVVDRGFPAFQRFCAHPEAGWIHLLEADGSPADLLRDTYDHAFVLFALAALAQTASHGAQARSLAERTLGWLDSALAHEAGGFHEGHPASLPRRSNPHMHLLEAMLAWHRVDGDRRFLDRADLIGGLFERHFFDPGHDTLGEHFDDDWSPAAPPLGDSVEPGHHFEWCWLLVRLAEAGGRDYRAQARRLYRFAIAHGLDAHGFAVDEIDRDGRTRRTSRRLWPQTELIKAHVAMGEHDAAEASFRALADTYLATKTRGLWIDQFDGSGHGVSPVVPASTLYHIDVAIDELTASR